MNRKSYFFLIISFIIILSGCSSKSEDITITNINGTSENMTINDLVDNAKGNVVNFNNNYVTGTITFYDKIKTIKDGDVITLGEGCSDFGKDWENKTAVISFETEGLVLYINKERDNVDINKLKGGDKVKVTTNISHADIYNDYLQISLASYSGKKCEFGKTPTKIEIVD